MPCVEQVEEWVEFFIHRLKLNHSENKANKPGGASQAEAEANSGGVENPNQAFFGHLESVYDARSDGKNCSMSSLIKKLVLFVISSSGKEPKVG